MALVCAFTKHFDPRLHLGIDSERDQAPSRFRVETEAQRLRKTVESGSRDFVAGGAITVGRRVCRNYIEQQGRHSCVGEVGGDAGAHGAGAEDGNSMDAFHKYELL